MKELNNVIVTGGTGVTGNALVRYLLKRGIKVTALVRPDSPRADSLPEDGGLKLVSCGLESLADIDHELTGEKYDAFFHLAWDGSRGKEKVGNRNNFKLQNRNVGYALDAVELCHRLECDTFLMTGSQAEYGPKGKPCSENDSKLPVNGYGMAKLCAEGMTRLLCKEYGIRHIWPILFSVYGPRDATESMIDTTLRAFKDNRALDYTKGEQYWNYLYSFDAAKALLLLAQVGEDGECYNVAGSSNRPLKAYVMDMYNAVKPELSPGIGAVPYRGGVPVSVWADTSKLVETTGFKEEYSFAEGIKEIYATL